MNEKRRLRLISIAKDLQGVKTCNGRNLHFSFILKNNQLLVTATNNYKKEHPKHKFGVYKPYKTGNPGYIPCLHSEVASISGFIRQFGHSDFSGLTIFNVRLNKNGEVLGAKCCKNCLALVTSLGFKNIEHT